MSPLQDVAIVNEFPDIRKVRDGWNTLQFHKVQYITGIFKTIGTKYIKFD